MGPINRLPFRTSSLIRLRLDPQFKDEGAIIHTEYDTRAYIEAAFPGRVDGRLQDITAIVYALLTEYGK